MTSTELRNRSQELCAAVKNEGYYEPCTVCHKKEGITLVLFVTRGRKKFSGCPTNPVLFVTRRRKELPLYCLSHEEGRHFLVVQRHGNKHGHQSILCGDSFPHHLSLINNGRCRHGSILFPPTESGWPGSGGRFQWKTLALPRAGAGHITGKVKSLRPICEHYNNDLLFLDGPGHGCHVIASVATDWEDRLLRFHGGWCWWKSWHHRSWWREGVVACVVNWGSLFCLAHSGCIAGCC